MKSLHYDQCFMIYTCLYMYNSLFHRDETKPTHIIGINSFLFLMQLIYKHSSPNYQHMINYWKLINKMLVYIYVCISWNIFNRIHIFAICDVFYFAISPFVYDIYIWSYVKLTKQLRLTFFFHHIQIIHSANRLYEDSHTSRTIASSQHHPRETRPLLSQPNLYRKRILGITYYEFVSYLTRNLSMFLLIHFLLFSYFFFLSSRLHIAYENESIDLLIFFHAFSYFFFFPCFFISHMKRSQSICLFFFGYSAISFFFLFFFISHMKRSQSICLFFFTHSAISFSPIHFHIPYLGNRLNRFAYFVSGIQLFLFLSLFFHIAYETKSIDLLIFFQLSSYFIFSDPFSHSIWNRLNRFCLFFFSHLAISFTCLFNFISDVKTDSIYLFDKFQRMS